MKATHSHSQPLQRIKVGLLGLAAVILLIGAASAIMRSATRERPLAVAGSARAEVVANMAAGNMEAESGEPLADLGVTPSAGNSARAASR